jgi:hypothetical protein
MQLPAQWRGENTGHLQHTFFDQPGRTVRTGDRDGPARFSTVTTTGVIEFNDRARSSTAALGCTPFRQETMVSTHDDNAALLTWRRGLGGYDHIEFTVVGTIGPDRSMQVCLRVLCRIDEIHGGPQLETFRSWDLVVPAESVVDFTVVMTDRNELCGQIRGSIGIGGR